MAFLNKKPRVLFGDLDHPTDDVAPCHVESEKDMDVLGRVCDQNGLRLLNLVVDDGEDAFFARPISRPVSPYQGMDDEDDVDSGDLTVH